MYPPKKLPKKMSIKKAILRYGIFILTLLPLHKLFLSTLTLLFHLWSEDYGCLVLCLLPLKDLSFFVPQMKGYKENIKLKASLKGSVDKLNAQLIDVKYGTGTHLRTSFSLSGMAEFDNLEYNVYFDTLTTSITDINSIKNPEDTTKNIFEIPENIKKAGKIFFNGNLTGNLQNIKIKGDLITGLGNILSDITITEDTKKSSYNIKGYLEGKELHIGNILENKDVGKFDFIDTLDINILKTGELEGISNGIVSNMQLSK